MDSFYVERRQDGRKPLPRKVVRDGPHGDTMSERKGWGVDLGGLAAIWRGGYVLQNIQRTGVDDAIRNKNKTPYNLNHTLVGEVGYKLSPNVVLFTRGQAMTRQFLTEMPFLYNSLTSQRFNQRYGILSVGISAGFY